MMWAGTGCRVITPRQPVHLMGYAARWDKGPSTGVHDDLYAKALFLKNERVSLLLISVDLCDLPGAPALQQDLATRLRVDHVLITCTHTHSGPYTAPTHALPDAFDQAWYHWACEQMAQAGAEAMAAAFSAQLGVAQADVPEVGKNRRPGSTITDPAMTVLAVWDAQHTVRALLVNYACHATVLDGNSFVISADFPGFLYTQLAQAYPQALVLFTNGAAGDINIGYSSDASALGEPMDIRTFEMAQRMARLLSDRALSLLKGLAPLANPPFDVRAFHADLPLRPHRPAQESLLAQIEEEQARMAVASSAEERRQAAIRKIYLQSLMDTLQLAGDGPTCALQGLLMRIGPLVMVSTPTEMFCEVGLAIKHHLPSPLMGTIVGYAGGYVGYLPTVAAMQQGGYEAEVSPFAPDAAEHVIAATAEALQGFS